MERRDFLKAATAGIAAIGSLPVLAMSRTPGRKPALLGVLVLAVMAVAQPATAAEAIEIWPKDSPQLKDVQEEHIPKLYLYPGPQSQQKKPAVLILPAGGYKHHSDMSGEVKWLNGLGIAVYVVKYRLPVCGRAPAYNGYKHPAPLHDAQRSMRIIRGSAEKWGLDPNRIGISGGSSGGHLASTLATHYDRGDKGAEDPIERMSCRPDYVFLINSVITMQGKFSHQWPNGYMPSRDRLLPKDPPQELVDDLSNELQVTPDTPPTFLHHGGQDKLVPAENSLQFFIALRKNNVAFSELHFFSHGGHFYRQMDWHPLGESWLRRLGVIGELHKDEKLQKSLTDKGAWANDNK